MFFILYNLFSHKNATSGNALAKWCFCGFSFAYVLRCLKLILDVDYLLATLAETLSLSGRRRVHVEIASHLEYRRWG